MAMHHLTLDDIVVIAQTTHDLEAKVPQLQKLTASPFFKMALIHSRISFFRMRRLPLCAEAESLARLTQDPNVQTVNVVPEGERSSHDFLVTPTEGNPWPVEVKSMTDTDEPAHVLRHEFEEKLKDAIAQLRLNGKQRGEIDLYFGFHRPERELVLLEQAKQWAEAIRVQSKLWGLTVSVIPASQMRYFGQDRQSLLPTL
jgi:hypothetical protein